MQAPSSASSAARMAEYRLSPAAERDPEGIWKYTRAEWDWRRARSLNTGTRSRPFRHARTGRIVTASSDQGCPVSPCHGSVVKFWRQTCTCLTPRTSRVIDMHAKSGSTDSYRPSRPDGTMALMARAGSPSKTWRWVRGCQMCPEWCSKISLHHFPRCGQGQFVAMFDAARQFVSR
jgi:hypothetical protein